MLDSFIDNVAIWYKDYATFLKEKDRYSRVKVFEAISVNDSYHEEVKSEHDSDHAKEKMFREAEHIFNVDD